VLSAESPARSAHQQVFFTRAVASALFLQGSLMFQKPTVADLRQAAHKLGMNPSDAYLDAVEQIITPLANAYALLDTAPDELPAVKYPRRQRPSAEENPHGAYMKTWIKGKPGDVQNSPVKIPSFCGLTLTGSCWSGRSINLTGACPGSTPLLFQTLGGGRPLLECAFETHHAGRRGILRHDKPRPIAASIVQRPARGGWVNGWLVLSRSAVPLSAEATA
jgi:hypothetical protein